MEGMNGAEKDVRKRRMVDATRRRRVVRCEWERERCRVMLVVVVVVVVLRSWSTV
jgi:hypothetical protein